MSVVIPRTFTHESVVMSHTHISPPRSLSRAQRKVIHPLGPDAFEVLRASQVAWGNRLLRLLGAPIPGERTLDVLADQMKSIIGEPYEVFFHSARTFAGSEFIGPDEGLFSTTFVLEPDTDMGLISVDLNLIQGCLEALLEDEPTEMRMIAPVTPRDFGLMNFVFLEIINWLCARGLPPISIPASAADPRIIARQFHNQSEIVELVYALSSATSAGLVRIFVPAVLVQTMEIFVTRGTHLNRQRRRLISSRLGPLRTRLRVEAARVSLGVEDYQSVGVGDILMPQRHGFELNDGPTEDGAPTASKARDAPAQARIYLSGLSGEYFPCRIRPHAEHPWQIEFCARLPITDSRPSVATSSKTTEPHTNIMEKSMPSEEIQKQRENAAQMGPILQKTQVEVQISVGEVMLSMSELAQLQSGYVLELQRSVKDGVDLYVDGTQVGVGELVLIEQRLGVRVRSIEA